MATDSRRHTWTPGTRIISASRRTDIPGCYAEWFINRIRTGYVAVPNPNNARQVSWLSLQPQDVHAIVFWTKNAAPMLPYLDELDARGYAGHYYFQYTITGYPRFLEARTPDLGTSVATFRKLAERLGADRVAWRYDPFIFLDCTPAGPPMNEEWHLGQMDSIAQRLNGATSTCVISFVDVYRKTRRNLAMALSEAGLPPDALRAEPRHWGALAEGLREIGGRYHLRVQTCAEPSGTIAKLNGAAVAGQCVNAKLLASLGVPVAALTKDKGQREECGCVASREIGMYDSCRHGCAFCYANSSDLNVMRTHQTRHNPNSAMLLDWCDDSEAPTDLRAHVRRADAWREEQLAF